MEQVPALDNTFGALYVGVTIAAVLYGVSCAQVFYYFQNYSENDGRVTKAVVIATLLSDTIHQVLISHAAYTYLITDYFAPHKLGHIVWSLLVEVIFNAITALLVQSYFAVRIWKFSKGNVPIAVCLAICILGGFVSSVVYVERAISIPIFVETRKFSALAVAVNVFGAVGDVLITVVFCVLLNRARSDFKRSNSMVNMLIAFSVQTGMLTSLSAIGSLISILAAPTTFIYISFYFLLGRLYCNSLLATLNVRKAISGRGNRDLGVSLRHTKDSNRSYRNQDIDIKVETLRYVAAGDPESHSGGLTMSKTDPGVIGGEYELESGQALHPQRGSP